MDQGENATSCSECGDGDARGFDFFLHRGETFAYEALVRGIAVQGGIGDVQLNINFLPNAVYEPASCIQATLVATEQVDLAPERYASMSLLGRRSRNVSRP
ncbi:MAG: hypothetical protein WEC99_06185 [Halofilum sp. (in: g-proteobacteria)]